MFTSAARLSAPLAALLMVGTAVLGFGSAASAAEADSIQAVYVVASDVTPVANRQSAIAANIETVNQWFAEQTGGRTPIFNRDGAGSISVPIVTLAESKATIAGSLDGDATFEAQIEAAVAGASDSRLFIVYEGTESSGACGYAGRLLVIPTENCNIFPNASARFPYGITYLMAHELTHMLGAVPSCAPNYLPGGHLTGDPRDILYQPTATTPGRDWQNLMLDPGNDDYFNHGRSDCRDIADSPLLSAAPDTEPPVTDPSGFNGAMSTATTIEELRASTTYKPAEHGDILRLYRAVFNREPDVAGAKYWIDEIAEGRNVGFEEIVTYIATPDQPEFAAAYADVATNSQFLTRVYDNMLGRVPDVDGFNYWLGLMDNSGLTRPEAVRWVSESQEFENLYPYEALVR